MIFWNQLIGWTLTTIYQLLNIYFWIVFVAVLLTWIEPNPYNPIVRFLYSVTEPVFDFVREHLPTVFGGIDLSPMVVLLAIGFLQRVVITSLLQYLTIGAAPSFG
ncbi:MAG TPA: YggT family protein [Candidatus Binataceae bacterium]|nr:YggT family protein [Candidatus Binataceae bacterium]